MPPDASLLTSSDNVDANVGSYLQENKQDAFSEKGGPSEFEEYDSEYLKAAVEAAMATAAIPKGSEPLAHPNVYGSDRETSEYPNHNNALCDLSVNNVPCRKYAC